MRPSQRLARSGYRPLAEINVTPLVDVMLVLLAIFMVTAPMLVASIKVDLPEAAAARPQDKHEPVVISIRADGSLALGHERVAEGDLVAKVAAQTQGDKARPILVNADRATPHGRVVAVMDRMMQGGFTRFGIIADPVAAPR